MLIFLCQIIANSSLCEGFTLGLCPEFRFGTLVYMSKHEYCKDTPLCYCCYSMLIGILLCFLLARNSVKAQVAPVKLVSRWKREMKCLRVRHASFSMCTGNTRRTTACAAVASFTRLCPKLMCQNSLRQPRSRSIATDTCNSTAAPPIYRVAPPYDVSVRLKLCVTSVARVAGRWCNVDVC